MVDAPFFDPIKYFTGFSQLTQFPIVTFSVTPLASLDLTVKTNLSFY